MDDALKEKILILSDRAWERRLEWPDVEAWLNNFTGEALPEHIEKANALYLLTQTMYFGQELIREMLRSVYLHLYKYPIVRGIRKRNGDTLDSNFIESAFSCELESTRFLGVGNPSESGAHLLYYFRQVNELNKDLFIGGEQILSIDRDDNEISISQKEAGIKRYIFIDDVLGSGTQIADYLKEIIREIRMISPSIELRYLSLFATSDGLKRAREPDLFGGNVDCIFELDSSFKCFSKDSRYFIDNDDAVGKNNAKKIALEYGQRLFGKHPLGYRNGQLLLAMSHNTPDNSLPILWVDIPKKLPWVPIFKRFHKNY